VAAVCAALAIASSGSSPHRSIGDLAAAYLRLLREEGHQDVLVVGSSIGGWIGAEMAVRDEAGLISSLVLIDSVGVLVEGQPIRDFFALDARGVAEYSFYDADRFYVDPAAVPPEQAAQRAANMVTIGLPAGAVHGHQPGRAPAAAGAARSYVRRAGRVHP